MATFQKDPQQNRQKWRNTKEKLLLAVGLLIIVGEFIHAELFGGSFHYEFLIAGLALCGISITQWTDRL